MKKPIILLLAVALIGGCGVLPGFVYPAGLSGPLIHGGVLSQGPAEGRWIIADEQGGRFCLTIQEQRILIVNVGCRSDGTGYAARIIDFPEAVVAGSHLVISSTYNPIATDETVEQLTFSGDLQVDGTYVGLLTVETSIPPDGTQERRFRQERVTEGPAFLARE